MRAAAAADEICRQFVPRMRRHPRRNIKAPRASWTDSASRLRIMETPTCRIGRGGRIGPGAVAGSAGGDDAQGPPGSSVVWRRPLVSRGCGCAVRGPPEARRLSGFGLAAAWCFCFGHARPWHASSRKRRRQMRLSSQLARDGLHARQAGCYAIMARERGPAPRARYVAFRCRLGSSIPARCACASKWPAVVRLQAAAGLDWV